MDWVDGSRVAWYSILLLKPKEFRAGKNGVRVELFSIPAVWDPVQAINSFRRDNVFKEDKDLPVFRWQSGANVTVRFLNSLKTLSRRKLLMAWTGSHTAGMLNNSTLTPSRPARNSFGLRRRMEYQATLDPSTQSM